MSSVDQPQPLRKELGLLDVYAVSTGATLSAGFFLLPGIAAQDVGPAIVLAYLLAALPMIPAMFSVVELATAMPRAGGVYYFLDRSMGPMVGMIGGLGTWLALILKVAFALVGMGAYLSIFFGKLSITPVAISLAILLGLLNLSGAKKSGKLQVFLVTSLLAALFWLIGGGLPEMQWSHFEGLLDPGASSILSTAGFVYISYVGVTKVASLSEEVKDPEYTLPRAVFLSLGTAVFVYVLGTMVMVGVIPPEFLAGDLTAAATAAWYIFGDTGRIVLGIAALMAFTSVANAGTLSASRYPLAMSRDRLMPKSLGEISPKGIPRRAIMITVGLIVVVLATLDVSKIAKLASAFQLLMFALVCLAVIVWREADIDSYDPGFSSPFYPWMQIFGILSSVVLITKMGWLPSIFSAGLVLGSILCFRVYATDKVEREGAIYHLFERLGRRRDPGLDVELRGILKEKGLRDEDPFDEIVAGSSVLDYSEETTFEQVVGEASKLLGRMTNSDALDIEEKILQGTRVGATPVSKGVALPHVRLANLAQAQLVIVRSEPGVSIRPDLPSLAKGLGMPAEQNAHALLFLASPQNDPGQHLRILAKLADRVEDEGFQAEWFGAKDDHALKEALLHNDNFLSLRLKTDAKTGPLIGVSLRELNLPESALLTLIRREGGSIVPKGRTVLEEGDRIMFIGTREAIKELEGLYE